MAMNWISSPFALKLVGNLLGKGFKNDCIINENMCKILRNKEQFLVKNKLFLLTTNDQSILEMCTLKMQTVTFKGHEEVLMAVKNWVKKYACFKQLNLENTMQSDVTGLLANVCMYKGTWKKSENHLVTVYNSFSYTDDIKYEARVLVVPTSDDDVVLAILVPNVSDVLKDLAVKLFEGGLTSALSSIQPAFAATCEQTIPTFEFQSMQKLQDSNKHTSATQYGEVRVDGGGVDIKVLTCLPVDKTKLSSDAKAPSICNKCFSFAVVFRDIPIFTGQLSP